jgi:hypothetical protein
LTENVIRNLQSKLLSLDAVEMKKLVDHSRDEAVQMALLLVSEQSRPASQYVIEEKYRNADALGDLIDDLLEAESTKKEEPSFMDSLGYNSFGSLRDFSKDGSGSMMKDDLTRFDDFGAGGAGNLLEAGAGGAAGGMDIERDGQISLDPERAQACSMWKQDYGVIPGVSWGSLPKTMQLEWKYNNCDMLIK